MKPISRKIMGRANEWWLLVAAVLVLSGCGALRPVQWPHLGGGGQPKLHVAQQVNRETADLSSDDIMRIMRRAGFTDQQILDLGTDLHNALLLSGAAKIMNGRGVETIYAVRTGYVFISSRTSGSFIYDLQRGDFGIVRPAKKPAP